jgi:hypothetical protein
MSLSRLNYCESARLPAQGSVDGIDKLARFLKLPNAQVLHNILLGSSRVDDETQVRGTLFRNLLFAKH